MGFHDLVSAAEAAALSGVSVATLQRFAEVGYLTVETDGDGLTLFSKGELGSVFGITPSRNTHSHVSGSASHLSVNNPTSPLSPENEIPPLTTTRMGASPTAGESSPRMQSLFDLLGKRDPERKDVGHSAPWHSAPGESIEPSAAPAEPSVAPSASWGFSSQTADLSSSSVSSSSPHRIGEQSQRASELALAGGQEDGASHAQASELQAENRKLRHVIELQEKILTLREAELKDLKEQRDWLKGRLERLEEKADRDQLLLLSETQTIRKLISLNEPKKSSFQLALEWLGLKSPSPERDGTIELRPRITAGKDSRASTATAQAKGTGPAQPKQDSSGHSSPNHSVGGHTAGGKTGGASRSGAERQASSGMNSSGKGAKAA